MELASVGKTMNRIDALEKVVGKASYVADMRLPGMLYGKILRSPHPHARIMRIDVLKAARLRGVKAIVTPQDDFAGKGSDLLAGQYLPADNMVRFVGEPVVAVAAETADVAEEALELIKVDYQELPALFDAEDAMRKDVPLILHPRPSADASEKADREYGPNVHSHFRIRRGDVERGFQEADLVLETRFSTSRVQHCALEPQACLAQIEPDGNITVWASAQGLYSLKSLLCEVFGKHPSQIRVITPYVGGGFGGKISSHTEPLAVLLAMKTGRPVKLVFTREEVFSATTSRVPMMIYIKDGVTRGGVLIARQLRVILNGGAFISSVPRLTRNCAFGAVGTYWVPNFKFDSYGVLTNEPMAGPFRGFGNSQVIWAIESHMDMLAQELGIDPLQMRVRNLLREGDINVTGEVTHSMGAAKCLEGVAESIEWGKRTEVGDGPWRIGKGVALGNKFSPAPTVSCALIKVHEDASAEIRHSAAELGQGCHTILAQIAAEELGLPLDKIKVVSGDTAITPYDGMTSGSKTTYNTGNAVRLACQDAKRQIFEMASDELEANPEDLELREGQVYVKGSPERAMKVTDLFLLGHGRVGYLKEGTEILGKATWRQDYTPEDPETGQGERIVAFYTHGAQAAEVAVNVETGQVKVLRFAAAYDMGQPINPQLCEQQMDGGMGMGIGSVLYEEMLMQGGRVANPNFMDYKIPTAMEMPKQADVQSMIAATPHRDGPFGAKGLGEAVLTPTAPAIANAVCDAVGARIRDLPVTPEKVLRALREGSSGQARGLP